MVPADVLRGFAVLLHHVSPDAAGDRPWDSMSATRRGLETRLFRMDVKKELSVSGRQAVVL
jgi:hypothetical protein